MRFDKFLCVFNLLVITFLIVLAGCTATDTSTTIISREAISSVGTVPATRILAEQTSPPVMVTQTPILAPSSIPTATPTMEATITETLTPTPTPTLTDTELRQLALELLENNNGCQLPCWWGITPGQTTWDTAYELIRIFDRIPHRFTVNSEYVIYEPVIPLPSELFEYDEVGHIYSVRNGIVESIEMPISRGELPEGYLTQYALPAFLTTYGPPAEVWVSTYRAAFEYDDLPFFAVLFYPEQGIVASFNVNGFRQGDFVQGCLQERPVSYLVLLPSGLNMTFEQVVGDASAFNREYLSLEEATGMEVMTFYETFKDSDNTTCLETPANLWR